MALAIQTTDVALEEVVCREREIPYVLVLRYRGNNSNALDIYFLACWVIVDLFDCKLYLCRWEILVQVNHLQIV